MEYFRKVVTNANGSIERRAVAVSADDPLPVSATIDLGDVSVATAADASNAAPSYVEGTSNPLSQTLAGDLRTVAKIASNQTVGLVAGSAIVGKVGIDQTTPGTTNAVDVTNFPLTVDVNSGNKSNNTLRVVLATDQPALTNKLLVTPDSVALPANQSVNVNQLAGTTTDTNSGSKSAGTLRVVLATDQPALTNALLVTASHGKTIKTVSGSLTSDTDVIAAVTSKRIKVIAYRLTTPGTTASAKIFKSNGTGGTEVWREFLQGATGQPMGAAIAIAAPSFLFATAAGEKLTLDVSDSDTIHYSITYFDDDAT